MKTFLAATIFVTLVTVEQEREEEAKEEEEEERALVRGIKAGLILIFKSCGETARYGRRGGGGGGRREARWGGGGGRRWRRRRRRDGIRGWRSEKERERPRTTDSRTHKF